MGSSLGGLFPNHHGATKANVGLYNYCSSSAAAVLGPSSRNCGAKHRTHFLDVVKLRRSGVRPPNSVLKLRS